MVKIQERSYRFPAWIGLCITCGRGKDEIKFGNVQVVVYMYNVCKSKFMHADVVRFCKAFAAMEHEIG